jgi:hypothetical protein
MLTVIGTGGAGLLGPHAFAQTADQAAAESGGTIALPPVEVTAAGGARTGASDGGGDPEKPFSQPLPQNIPAVIETVTAKEIRQDINAVTSTDTLKYLPSIDLRTRYEGEQNPMIGFPHHLAGHARAVAHLCRWHSALKSAWQLLLLCARYPDGDAQ